MIMVSKMSRETTWWYWVGEGLTERDFVHYREGDKERIIAVAKKNDSTVIGGFCTSEDSDGFVQVEKIPNNYRNRVEDFMKELGYKGPFKFLDFYLPNQ